ncbi:MAG: helix-turn-helix domain-containing protein [Pseudomonadota bacterium]
MESLTVQRLSTLGHPQRLALFRLLMRRYPDRVPATELAQALGLKPNTLSSYINALMAAGLATQTRAGTSRLYSIEIDAVRDTLGYLTQDCCRGRPDICAPLTAPPQQKPRQSVLFLCNANSARSIFAEAILRDIAPERFTAHSAGVRPGRGPHPLALDVLAHHGHDTLTLRSKHLSELQAQGTTSFDFVFTVCDRAANEDCPAWPGHPISAHWGLPDPVAATGTPAERSLAFHETYTSLRQRLTAFAALPFDTLDRLALQHAVDDIARTQHPEFT